MSMNKSILSTLLVCADHSARMKWRTGLSRLSRAMSVLGRSPSLRTLAASTWGEHSTSTRCEEALTSRTTQGSPRSWLNGITRLLPAARGHLHINYQTDNRGAGEGVCATAPMSLLLLLPGVRPGLHAGQAVQRGHQAHRGGGPGGLQLHHLRLRPDGHRQDLHHGGAPCRQRPVVHALC